jgi:hypothetical protein
MNNGNGSNQKFRAAIFGFAHLDFMSKQMVNATTAPRQLNLKVERKVGNSPNPVSLHYLKKKIDDAESSLRPKYLSALGLVRLNTNTATRI